MALSISAVGSLSNSSNLCILKDSSKAGFLALPIPFQNIRRKIISAFFFFTSNFHLWLWLSIKFHLHCITKCKTTKYLFFWSLSFFFLMNSYDFCSRISVFLGFRFSDEVLLDDTAILPEKRAIFQFIVFQLRWWANVSFLFCYWITFLVKFLVCWWKRYAWILWIK